MRDGIDAHLKAGARVDRLRAVVHFNLPREPVAPLGHGTAILSSPLGAASILPLG
jgi:hypothetical protein